MFQSLLTARQKPRLTSGGEADPDALRLIDSLSQIINGSMTQ
jgi:hypothetical protein